jgi:DNA-binding transcriptional MerR regulator
MSITSKLTHPIFSHAEALVIAGITAEGLLTWHRRGVAPETPNREPGRGRRRLYSTLDVVSLALIKRFADARYPLDIARDLAQRVLRNVALLVMARTATNHPARYLAITPDAKVELVPAANIQSWMDDRQMQELTLVDFGALIDQVRIRYWNVFDSKQARLLAAENVSGARSVLNRN